MKQKIRFETSLGVVEGILSDVEYATGLGKHQEVTVTSGEGCLSHFNYHCIAYFPKTGWVEILLDDGYDGVPEYKAELVESDERTCNENW